MFKNYTIDNDQKTNSLKKFVTVTYDDSVQETLAKTALSMVNVT